MADVSVTATSVAKDSTTQYLDGFLGATVTAGQTVYLDSTSNTFKLADADASVTTAAVTGIALNGGVSGQPVKVAVGGNLNPGFTVTAAAIYIQSATPGGIAPVADLATGMYSSIIGIGLSSSSLMLVLKNSGIAKP